MKVRTSLSALAFVSLALALSACGPDALPGTPVDSLNESGTGSLRAAIAAAAAGDTLRMTQSGTVTLTSPLTVDKNLTILADGVTFDAAGKGRALEVAPGASVTIKGGTLTGGVGKVLSASLNAGRLAAWFGPVSMDDLGGKLSAAGLRGQADPLPTAGGVILNTGALTLDSVSVTGGKANIGGGIYNAAGATLNLTGTTKVTGNDAPKLVGAPSTVDHGIGGGIFNKGTLTISGGHVDGNTAQYAGAGVYNGIGSTLAMSSGSVDGNIAAEPVTTTNGVTGGSAGAGIYTNGDLTISGGSVSGNTASYFGAGVTSQQVKDASGALIVPKLTITGGTVANNKLTDATRGGGGGIWENGSLNMSGGTVSGNTGVYGGGLGLQGDATITGGSIEGNTSLAGGGAFVFKPGSAAVTLTFGGNAVVKNNTATDSGGGLAMQIASLKMTGGTVQDNTAKNNGGGISFSSGAVGTIQGGSIQGNKVTAAEGNGGGLRLFNAATVTLSGGEIKNNTALLTGGGATVGNKATLNMTGGSIAGNSVTGTDDTTLFQGRGGGVRIFAGGVFNASGGSIQGNTAAIHGGAVSVGAPDTAAGIPAAKFTMSGTASLTGNRATAGAGGGVTNSGTFLLQGGSITGNTSALKGGGLRNFTGATFTQSGGSVTGNTPDNVQTDQ